MATRGRPTKYHDARVDRILHLIREGNTLKVAAAAAGVHYDTFNEWRKAFPDFDESVKAAEVDAEQDHVRNIKTHSADSWQASAWWLERRRSGDWRKTDAHEVSGPGGGPIPVVVERVSYGDGDPD